MRGPGKRTQVLFANIIANGDGDASYLYDGMRCFDFVEGR